LAVCDEQRVTDFLKSGKSLQAQAERFGELAAGTVIESHCAQGQSP
jgi:hypothetical protein